MPGIHTILDRSNQSVLTEADFSFTRLRENFSTKILLRNSWCCTAVSYYDGFPFQEWDDGESHILIQGMIYNRSDEEVREKLREISREFVHGSGYKSLVTRFVESSDGDFSVQIIQKSTKRCLIFNDYAGRMSLFYYCNNDLFICSTEIKTVLRFIPKIRMNRSSLAEFLMFEFPLGNKTLFLDIFRLQSSRMLVVEEHSGKFILESASSSEINFELKDPFRNKAESLAHLKTAFLTGVRDRVTALEKHGYRIIADLSGGYDSRTVLGGLNTCTQDVDYFTNEYSRDESRWAKGIFEQLGSPGRYHKCSFVNSMDEGSIGQLVYNTDGFVNYETTSTCYNDIEYIKTRWPKKSAEFSGFGGEFIRHPYKPFFHSRKPFHFAIYHAEIPLDAACRIVKADPQAYQDELISYLDSYPEKNRDDRLRRFYYEYYHNLVGSAADNRKRIHFWTVNPLWSPAFIKIIFSRVPLRWIRYGYFIRFMKEVDPRLVAFPIFDSKIDLKSEVSIAWYDLSHRANASFYSLLKIRTPSLYRLYYSLRHNFKKDHPERYEALQKTIRSYYEGAGLSRSLFDLKEIEANLFRNDYDTRRVITLMIYVRELETRFKEKIET